eukprot:CAMPEP_0118723304 /NCGR_PEP_ID=MMETSP0800-20121206/31930_1 /TAXON_ID=210618 ORGANISM="Striatella unipunctata, Strain CCMP2910" /NCGR_SAMPLE_ID=MMETSP0800 /ASSEMBLY_ACC=CAM_ASM_000638 /LENGTH=91 /DNA_ID=CAMNT_0006631717 /DNA_START=219 /DNA_END=494 /DNA_ORIENTATION=-
MARRRVALWVESNVFALVGVGEDVTAFAAQDDNGVAGHVKVVFGNDALHAETAVDTLLFVWFDEIEVLAGLEKSEFVVTSEDDADPIIRRR